MDAENLMINGIVNSYITECNPDCQYTYWYIRDTTKPELWTLDWTMDGTLDSIMDSIIAPDF